MSDDFRLNEVGMPIPDYDEDDFIFFVGQIRAHVLPFDENESELIEIQNEFGETLAHIAAEEGLLGNDFPHWGHTSFEGVPVAHYAAAKCALPDNFSEWDIEDSHGIKTAYIAIENKCCMDAETRSQYQDEFNDFLEEKEATTLEEAANHVEVFLPSLDVEDESQEND